LREDSNFGEVDLVVVEEGDCVVRLFDAIDCHCHPVMRDAGSKNGDMVESFMVVVMHFESLPVLGKIWGGTQFVNFNGQLQDGLHDDHVYLAG
jgi:hypothetical protein